MRVQLAEWEQMVVLQTLRFHIHSSKLNFISLSPYRSIKQLKNSFFRNTVYDMCNIIIKVPPERQGEAVLSQQPQGSPRPRERLGLGGHCQGIVRFIYGRARECQVLV